MTHPAHLLAVSYISIDKVARQKYFNFLAGNERGRSGLHLSRPRSYSEMWV